MSRPDSERYQFRTDRIPTTDIAKSRELIPLWDFANRAFGDRLDKTPQLRMMGLPRFEKPDDFLDEMGPDGVSFILYAKDLGDPECEEKIIATAGYKPFSKVLELGEKVNRIKAAREAQNRTTIAEKKEDSTTRVGNESSGAENEHQLFTQLEKLGPMEHKDDSDDVPRYEVMTVCVHPQWQKQGLADKMLGTVQEEVASLVRSQGKGPEFKLVVRALKETNEAYWTSKGFKTVGTKAFEAGLFGDSAEFTLLDMIRDHSTGRS